jgi:hypothetical protein
MCEDLAVHYASNKGSSLRAHIVACVAMLLYVCPQATIYVSPCYYMYVLRPLYMCRHVTICMSSGHYICVDMLLYVCPHTTIYVSTCYYMYVLTPLYMCPHTTLPLRVEQRQQPQGSYRSECLLVTIYMSSHHYICALILLCRYASNQAAASGLSRHATSVCGLKLLVYAALSF